MSSSDERRRPRVAGQRRRHGRAPDARRDTTVPDAEETAAEPASRQVGAAPPVREAGAAPEVREPAHGPEVAGEGRNRRFDPALRVPIGALVLALALLAAVASVSLRDSDARAEDARAAVATARTSLEQLLSYDYQTLDQQAEQNAALLTGGFRAEYAATMKDTIAPVAQQDKAVVRARTYEAGVMGQTEDTVRVQVFLNQAKTSEGSDAQPSIDQNRVIATMRRVGPRWLIEDLAAY